MKKRFFTNHRFRRRVEKASAANGYKAKYEEVVARVDVEIDLERIFAELGAKALHNKSQRSSEAGGMLVAKVSGVSKL